MKKRMMRFLCAALCLALAASFCGCGMLKTIRENANRPIIDSPAEDTLAQLFNTALENTRVSGVDVTEAVTLDVGKPAVEPETESDAAAVLITASNTLKKIIMEQKPGSGERELKADAEDTLLRAVDAADTAASAVRNQIDVAVTDADGNQQTDEDGNLLTEKKISDNILILTFTFGADAAPAEGEEEEAPAVPPETAVVEKYFGKGVDDAAVKQEVQKIAAYFTLDDYTVTYTSCRIDADIDLERTTLRTVTYEKDFTVTAHLTGVGAFAGMGALTVTFDGSVKTEYDFDFSADE